MQDFARSVLPFAAALLVSASLGTGLLTPQSARAAERMEEMSAPMVGDEAPDFALPALGGQRIKLSTLVRKGPVVLVMLRGYPGYQCPFCTRQFGEFLGRSAAFKKAKARVVFIYPGPSDQLEEHASEFVKGKDYPPHFSIVPDPDYAVTNAYHLRWEAANETAYPATFVLDSKRRITFAGIAHGHGDRVTADAALKALAR